MNNPKISILVPVFNVEKYINRCLDSILVQTFTDFECILVDDGSPDKSGMICDEYALKDDRIKVIHKKKNEGLPQARKTGFENSSGDYIQFIDSDDYVKNNMLEKLYAYAIESNYDMICCDWYKQTKNNEIVYERMPEINNYFISNIKNIILDLGLKACVWNKFFKRNIIKNIIFPKKSFHEDKYIVTQAFYYAKNICYINSAFYYYVYNNESLVHNPMQRSKRYKEEKINFKNVLKFVKKVNGNDLNILEPELSNRKKQIDNRRIKFKEFKKKIKKRKYNEYKKNVKIKYILPIIQRLNPEIQNKISKIIFKGKN